MFRANRVAKNCWKQKLPCENETCMPGIWYQYWDIDIPRLPHPKQQKFFLHNLSEERTPSIAGETVEAGHLLRGSISFIHDICPSPGYPGYPGSCFDFQNFRPGPFHAEIDTWSTPQTKKTCSVPGCELFKKKTCGITPSSYSTWKSCCKARAQLSISSMHPMHHDLLRGNHPIDIPESQVIPSGNLRSLHEHHNFSKTNHQIKLNGPCLTMF